MATKKKVAVKKAAPAKKVAPAKKPVAKKATPAKKAVAKKIAPAKKPIAKKAAPAKKAVPAKKPVAKKVIPAKKATPIKKAAPTKKSIAKKVVPAKKVVAKPVKKEVVKPVKPAKPVKEAKPPKAAKPAKVAPKKFLGAKPITKPAEPPKPMVATPVQKKQTLAEKYPKSKENIIAHRNIKELKRTDNKPSATIASNNNYKRSILDTLDDAAPRLRYSDEKLQDFKEHIFKKLDLARKELVYLQNLIQRKDEAGTEDTENKFASMEDGSASQDREMMNQLASRQITLIEKLEQALGRIENKTYGVCRLTGQLIDEKRLKAVPHATLSMEAKEKR